MTWLLDESTCFEQITAEEPQTFSQSSASPSTQQIGEESTDDGSLTFESSVDALGNNTISMKNNTSSPVVVSSIANFIAAATDVLSATTSQALRNNAVAVSNTVILSPQITIGGLSECLITVELPKPIRVRVIVSRASATVFNIIYKRVW